METIRPIEPLRGLQPAGLKQIPQKDIEIPKAEKLDVPGAPVINAEVGWTTLILLWIKTNLGNDILNFFNGATMNSKLWYTSKTFWTNVIGLAWTFVGPLIGIPALDPDTMIAILGVLNVILRLITKQPVSIS